MDAADVLPAQAWQEGRTEEWQHHLAAVGVTRELQIDRVSRGRG